MPRDGITVYDLLISCPGDVEKYVNVAKKCIENFNRLYGTIYNVEIVGRHWSTDSYSQSGDNPQELLNKQFVRKCDAAVAIFWTKFGTPTDKYESGTEEEIEEMLSAGKQVFMYFINEPVFPSELNIEQYNKIKDFREKYKNRGIYFEVRDEEEFKNQFTNDLTRYFLSLIKDSKKSHNGEIKNNWNNILSDETKNNDEYSYKASEIMRNMKKEDGLLFQKIYDSSINLDDEIILPNYNEYLTQCNINYNDVIILSELGLIHNNVNYWTQLTVTEQKNIIQMGPNFAIVIDAELSDNIKIRSFNFTRVGVEIASALEMNPKVDNVIVLANILEKEFKDKCISLRKIEKIEGDKFYLSEEDLLR